MENQNAANQAKHTWDAQISRFVAVKDAQGKWRFPFATWICALAPWVFLLNMILLALHVRFGLGHWPQPMIENYNSPLFKHHELLCTGVVIFTVYVSLPAFGGLLLFHRFRLSLWDHLIQLAVYLTGWGAVALIAWLDPFRYVTWLLD